MPERFCAACGAKLISINRSEKCRVCREKLQRDRSQTAREAKQRERQLQQRKQGLVLLHRCLSRPEDPPDTTCICRKWISIVEAKALVTSGSAVDFVSRRPLFVERDVLEVGLLKNPPRSSLGGRVTTVLCDRTFTPEEVERLEKLAKEDRAWRRIESIVKTRVEHELALEAMQLLTVEIDSAEWFRNERASRDIPVVMIPVNFDSRTEGGVGIDVPRFHEKAAA
jgi:hypothetical protein